MSDAAVAAGPDLPTFIARWKASAAAERANYQLFLTELCAVIGVPQPEPTRPDASQKAYVFERDVVFQNPDGSTSHGRIDLYTRHCFLQDANAGERESEVGADERQEARFWSGIRTWSKGV